MMVFTKVLMGSLLCLLALTSIASNEHSIDRTVDAKHVAEEIFKKCMKRAVERKEEEVCKARRPAIELCVEQEKSAKDAKAVQTKCELLLIAPSK